MHNNNNNHSILNVMPSKKLLSIVRPLMCKSNRFLFLIPMVAEQKLRKEGDDMEPEEVLDIAMKVDHAMKEIAARN